MWFSSSFWMHFFHLDSVKRFFLDTHCICRNSMLWQDLFGFDNIKQEEVCRHSVIIWTSEKGVWTSWWIGWLVTSCHVTSSNLGFISFVTLQPPRLSTYQLRRRTRRWGSLIEEGSMSSSIETLGYQKNYHLTSKIARFRYLQSFRLFRGWMSSV